MSTPERPLYLGVDAGNSKTVAVLADGTGRVLGHGRAGCGDIYGAESEGAAVEAVLGAIRQAGEPAGIGFADLAGARAALCLAGLDWPDDTEFWVRALADRLPTLAAPVLLNDGFAVLRSGAPDGIGIGVAAGTGAAVGARGPAGTWSGSFWLTRPTGGYGMGQAAVFAVVRAELGLAPPTVLREQLLALFGRTDVESLLYGATARRPARPVRYADAARVVLAAADAGDPVAGDLVADQGAEFARYARVAAGRVGLDPTAPVVLGGSVMTAPSSALRDATRKALAGELPAAPVLMAPIAPVLGAVAEAMAVDNPTVPADLLHGLAGYRFPEAALLT